MSRPMAGMDVVLIDATLESAEKGKAYAAKLLAKEVEKGRRKRSRPMRVLERIQPTVDYADARRLPTS